MSVDGITYTAGDGNLVDNGDGTWDLTIPAANELADGEYDVIATVTDGAGNATGDTSVSELVIDTIAPVTPTVDPQTTTNITPLISGTATVATGETLTVEVDDVFYVAGDGNLVNNGDGTWDLTIPAANELADGEYDVIATVTDSAGNATVDASASELVVDTVAPVTPTVVPQTTNDVTPIISGTATVASGETLTVEVDGITYTAGNGNLVDNSDGTWDLTIPVGSEIDEGTYDVVAIITDAAGNASSDATTSELVVDTTAPAAPTTASQNTNNTLPVISGTASVGPGETLTVTVGGVTYTTGDDNLVDNGDGTWELNVPVGSELVEGIYDVTATITDAAGNASSDATVGELVVDTTPPVAPTTASQNTNNTFPVISGTASVGPGETLKVTVDGVTYTAGDGDLVDNGDGTWDLTIPAADELADGEYDVIATVTDSAGNATGDASVSELVVDTVVPVKPTVVPQTTNDVTPIISGTATVALGEALTVEVDGVVYTAGEGDLVDNSDGTWDLTIPAANELADGEYNVIATVIDSAGNASSDAPASELVIDTLAPAAPTTTSQTTSSTTPLIIGTATVGPDETLTVSVDGVTYTAGDGNLVHNDDGTWGLTIPGDNDLADGDYGVTTTITDEAGNATSDINLDALVVDTTSPMAPSVTSLTTNDNTPVIEGTALLSEGETLSIELNGVLYTKDDGNLVVNVNGTWVLSVPAFDALADGRYEVIATVTDNAGNFSSDPGSEDLLVDTAAPNAPGVSSLTSRDTTPAISGTADLSQGDTLRVELDGRLYTQGDGSLSVNPDGTWTLAISTPLVDGQYNVIATITDAVGNFSTDPSVGELLIDATAPAAPSVVPVTTAENTPTITGIADLAPGERLAVEVNGIIYNDGDGNLMVNSDGTWELMIPESDSLAEGNYPVTVTVTDATGNITETFSPTGLVIQNADDFDGDGIPDVIDLDDDNDGIPDTAEGQRDSDGDGQPDSMDLDSDNDGIFDILEVGGDDTDNDGQVDDFRDSDDNGLSDDLQIVPFDLVDSDRDLIPNFRDVDSDNDGLTDILESSGVDDDNDGRIDGFTDANGDGADDMRQMMSIAPLDSDSDGVPNYLDLDSDNDGNNDAIEAGASDDLDDGIADTMLDTDGDGIPDSVDITQTGGNDADDDGIDDRFDASFLQEDDTDGDGIVDSADPDANGDGLADDLQNAPALGQALPDVNDNGVADAYEAEPGFLRTGLSGRGCSIGSPTNTRGSVDPLFALMISALAALLWRRRSIR